MFYSTSWPDNIFEKKTGKAPVKKTHFFLTYELLSKNISSWYVYGILISRRLKLGYADTNCLWIVLDFGFSPFLQLSHEFRS